MSLHHTIGKIRDLERLPKKIAKHINQVRIMTHSTPPIKKRSPSYWREAFTGRGAKKSN